MSKHVAVWLDHKEARIFNVDPDTIAEAKVLAPKHNVHHKHPRGPEGPKAHPEDAKHFYHEIAQALEGALHILVVGPGVAKLELIKHVHKHHHALEAHIEGVETVDHPTDNQLIAYAKKYFKIAAPE